jgi:hypothetical protein
MFSMVKARISTVAICAGILVLFLWPAILNGLPFFSPDTSAYIRGFDAGLVWLFDCTSAWTSWAAGANTARWGAIETIQDEARSFQNPKFIIAGRSVSYGALLYIGELLGGFWAAVVIQAAAALAAISLTLRHFKVFNRLNLLAAASGLALLSSLPFFASSLLPDIFAALEILAAANLIALGGRLSSAERLFWVLILAVAAVFHPSHLAILGVLAAVAVSASLIGAKVSRVGSLALAVALGIGIASELCFNLAVEKMLGVEVTRPPVITARIIADGPGEAYLRERCPAAGYVLCDFVDRLSPNSDAFLWNLAAEKGVYTPASIETRRQLSREQYRFAAAVFAYDPVGQLVASLKDALQQLTMIGLSDFAIATKEAYLSLPKSYAERTERSAAGRNEFPFTFFSGLTALTIVLSLSFVTVTLIRHWRVVSREQKLFFVVILIGQLSNAVICGALSGPHERYQARLAWLFPFAAIVLHYEMANKRREPEEFVGR